MMLTVKIVFLTIMQIRKEKSTNQSHLSVKSWTKKKQNKGVKGRGKGITTIKTKHKDEE